MHFKYLGEPPRSYVKSYGEMNEITYIKKDGTPVSLKPIPPATQFVIGQDIGYDIVDPTGIELLSSDPRFQKMV